MSRNNGLDGLFAQYDEISKAYEDLRGDIATYNRVRKRIDVHKAKLLGFIEQFFRRETEEMRDARAWIEEYNQNIPIILASIAEKAHISKAFDRISQEYLDAIIITDESGFGKEPLMVVEDVEVQLYIANGRRHSVTDNVHELLENRVVGITNATEEQGLYPHTRTPVTYVTGTAVALRSSRRLES